MATPELAQIMRVLEQIETVAAEVSLEQPRRSKIRQTALDRIYKLAHVARGECANSHDDWKADDPELWTAEAELMCWHGHTTRQVGCVSCVIVFELQRTAPAPQQDEET